MDLHDGDIIKTGDTCFQVGTFIEKPVNQIIRCQRCGKDVSAEVNPKREGEFLCADCANNLASDPGEILRALFNNLQSPNKHFQIPNTKSWGCWEKVEWKSTKQGTKVVKSC